MTVTTTSDRVSNLTNGSSTDFNFNFYILDSSHLSVWLVYNGVKTLQTLGVDYTVVSFGPTGGTIRFSAGAPAAGGYCIIKRNIPLTQEIHYPEADEFPAATHELGLDKLTMLVQRAISDQARSLQTDEADPSSNVLTIPISRASSLLGFDASGNAQVFSFLTLGTQVVSTFIQNLLDDSSQAEACATLGARLESDDVLVAPNKQIVFEGATDNAFETRVGVVDPTADNTITLPDKSGTVALMSDFPQLQAISAPAAGNALTISAGPLMLDFHSATAGDGSVTRVSGTPANLVISSGSTLGLVAGQLGRVAVVAMNSGGTIELAVRNMAGGLDVSESGVISTTAEGGAGGADSANVWYSTTARTNLPYRFLGYFEGSWATPGQWTDPAAIRGAGGHGVAFSGLGYGRSWQSVSRTAGTTYYNTTGRSITLLVAASGTGPIAGVMSATVNGLTMQIGGMFQGAASAINFSGQIEIPPGAAYSYSCNVASTCYELR